jgi:release factor glutamine methyltransferase
MDTRSLLLQDKYENDRSAVESAAFKADIQLLNQGMPLAYVIGWVPFLGLRIHLDSRPLIPRPETEWWTEKLIGHLEEKFDDQAFSIGLAVLSHFKNVQVTFLELDESHCAQIEKNISENNLDRNRVTILSGDLFEPLRNNNFTFDCIASNPPYIPEGRVLDESVLGYEPTVALFSGPKGLDLIQRIAHEAPSFIKKSGELWMECDSENAEQAHELLILGGAKSAMLCNDQYGRSRFVVGQY